MTVEPNTDESLRLLRRIDARLDHIDHKVDDIQTIAAQQAARTSLRVGAGWCGRWPGVCRDCLCAHQAGAVIDGAPAKVARQA